MVEVSHFLEPNSLNQLFQPDSGAYWRVTVCLLHQIFQSALECVLATRRWKRQKQLLARCKNSKQSLILKRSFIYLIAAWQAVFHTTNRPYFFFRLQISVYSIVRLLARPSLKHFNRPSVCIKWTTKNCFQSNERPYHQQLSKHAEHLSVSP